MEVLTSACFVLILYCSEWFGFKQCYAYPVPVAIPTILNYYDSSANQNWNWKYKQLRNPESYHDKFVFPSKEPVLNIAERSGGFPKESVKIVFPDEVPEPTSSNKENARPSYQYSHKNSNSDMKPVWKIRQEESEAISNSPRSRLPLPSPSPSSTTTTTLSPSEKRKRLEKEKVDSAVQDWYGWYLERKKTNTLPQRNRNNFGDSNSSSKVDPVISDQSLVAGLKDQKCPEGQIRLENGECRATVEI